MPFSVTAANVYEVRQNEITMLSRRRASPRRDALITVGINPCIGVLLWDDNWVVLGHLQDSTPGTYEAAYDAVLAKMRALAGHSSIVYGAIAYARAYDSTHTDHRERVPRFLRSRGVVMQTDIIGGKSDGGMNVAVSRHAGRLHPAVHTSFVYPRPTAPAQIGPLGALDSRRIMGQPLPPISVVTAFAVIEINDAAGLALQAPARGL